MKKKLVALFYFISLITFSQQKQFLISWEGTRAFSTESYEVKLPSFSDKHFNYAPDKGIEFIAQWKLNFSISGNSVKITNVKYETLPSNELGDLDVKNIPSELEYSLTNSKSRNESYAFLSISPIIKSINGEYKKILSFTVNYNTNISNASHLKSFGVKTLTNSVLQSGEWYRFYVDTTGVFKLTKSFIKSLGVNVDNIDPKNIKIYGNGGSMIPYSNAINHPIDITENAIKVVGEEDGVFNDNDYVLFYARGPRGYDDESKTNINIYTDKTYYYLTTGSSKGKRIQTFSQPSGDIDLSINTYQDYKFYEKDDHNIAHAGRRWFENIFDVESERTFEFNFPDLVIATPIKLSVFAAAASTSITAVNVAVNNINTADLLIGPSNNETLANDVSYSEDINVNDEIVSVKLTYNNGGNPGSEGYLDFISIEAERELKFTKKQFRFENDVVTTESGIGEYSISNASEVSEIWDVTDMFNVTNYINESADVNLKFTSTLGTLRTYMAVTPLDYYLPYKEGTSVKVANQNLKGTIFLNDQGQFQDLDYLIIAPDNMLSQAERLAGINKDRYGLNVKTVSLSKIYNEFSTGNQDIGAIRNFVKYIYDNASSAENKLKYLCLMGDSSYDYKDRLLGNTNNVPSWHSYNSLKLTNSFISDDFFGMMDNNEGTMVNSDKLDIAIGRILAQTPQQAKEMVDKIVNYYSKEAFGNWRNNFLVISDDVDHDWEAVLQQTTDVIGDLVSQQKPSFNVLKLHSDSFKQETSSGGERYPKVTEEIIDTVEKGALVINYFGHGGEDGLAQERLITKTDVQNFSNVSNLSCFVTITCEFTRFDNPLRPTAGEYLYWNKNGGAITLITTTRQIFAPTGVAVNKTLGEYLFSYSIKDNYEDYEYPSVAEALRLTKTDPSISSRDQRRLVFFIGDPAMKLTIPKPSVKLTKVNDVPITQPIDTLKALSRVKFSGEVTDVFGTLLTNYNGKLATVIYDKFIDRTTLGNNHVELNGELITMDFKTLGEIIYRGNSSINNGLFEFEFIVPKDIGQVVDFGRVSFYATTTDVTEDQSGASVNTIKIGGLNVNADVDNAGPLISLFMNDENFVNGGITNESPNLLVKLEDISGINTSSGIGHDIVAIIDNDEVNQIVLNDYYETEVDDFQKGFLSYSLKDLEPGLHTLTVKAWDVYNNSSVTEIQFMVYNEAQNLVIDKVLNYPNPLISHTEFWFTHNSSGVLDVSVQIFTVSGKLVRTINGQTSAESIKSLTSTSRGDIIWDGRDDFGNKIGKGVYVYKLSVYSSVLNQKAEKTEKLVIL